ncbi:sugar ABC transporter permease [Paenibacillus swuensis]|uniref:Sugar ABC transporter permease n=1 Tax=Paenibacillus swuensis TaxID=1178515 RepID=A0A172TH16_9BACL|nr:ABC transporter permease subunit [Paenibacillus swuensis]ANE46157.1 sugar ABC transporter permease [Paenibacillus swuensis]
MQTARSYFKYWPLYLMLLPTTIILIVNNYIPMFGLLIAFKNVNYTDGIFGSPWAGFKNFEFLFRTNDAWIITRNTLLYNIVFITMNIVIGVSLAMLLNELRGKVLHKIYQSAMFFPFFLSMVVVSYLVYAFLNSENGYMNASVFRWFGWEPADWYADPKYWPFILPLVNIWKSIGYYMVYFVAAMVTFNSEYYEAAVIDGASKWQQAIRITLPQLTPLIVILTLLQIGRIFYADFGLFYQVPLNAGAIYETTNVIDTYVYRTFITMGDVGMSSAAGFYQSFVGFVLVFLSNYIVRKINKDNALF